MEEKKTASAFVVDNRDRLLCVFHKKFGKWIQPGGHLEGNESPLEAAIREVYEETGIPIKILSKEPLFVEKYDTVVGKQLDYQYVAAPLTTEIKHNEESKEAKFLSLEELKKVDIASDLLKKYEKVLLYKRGC